MIYMFWGLINAQQEKHFFRFFVIIWIRIACFEENKEERKHEWINLLVEISSKKIFNDKKGDISLCQPLLHLKFCCFTWVLKDF